MKATDFAKVAKVSKLGAANYAGVINGGDTVRISNEMLMSAENAELLKTLKKDTRRGASIYFKEGEEIYFFPLKDQMYEIEGWELTSTNDVRLMLRCAAYTERYKEFFFPLTLTRQLPVDEDLELDSGEIVNSRVYQLKDNALGELLLPEQTDLERVAKLAGKVVKITEVCKMHGRSRKDPEKLIPRTIYKFNL